MVEKVLVNETFVMHNESMNEWWSQFFAISLTLFFVIDALGHLPDYQLIIASQPVNKQRSLAIRELSIALVIMIAFHYVGQLLLTLLQISPTTVNMGGGIILFLIAIRLIFDHPGNSQSWNTQKPFIVPLATPLFAGPSVLSVIMIYAQDDPSPTLVLCAIVAAWAVSSLIYLFATPILRLIREKGSMACQRLMGLIIAIVAIQMFLIGLKTLLKS